MRVDWTHQTFAVLEVARLVSMGVRRIVVTSPTGGGKTRIMQRIIEHFRRPTLILTNRTMLMEQTALKLEEQGFDYDMRAAGYEATNFADVTVGMVQTICQRWERGQQELPQVDIVILDEAHNETGDRVCRLLKHYADLGAVVILITETPIGIGHMADELVVAGVTSDLRRCGALVPAITYAPDEPAADAFKSTVKGVMQIKDEVKEVYMKAVIGRIIDYYHRLNPDQRPTIMFAPGVAESIWLTEQFNLEGIPSSHIDSDRIIINGEELPANRTNRERLHKASISGATKVVSNRFVLREGIDWGHLAHGVFACSFGSLKSYLQSGGRLLRAHPSLTEVTVQDHGGNFWRHDSLNADREWSLEDTDKSIQDAHDERMRSKSEPEPVVCPKCAKVRLPGTSLACPSCGFMYRGKSRMVIQTDGRLTEVAGDIYKTRKINTAPDAHKKWVACVFRSQKSGRTFAQARATYQHENYGTVPGPDFPLMPTMASDWAMPVKDVPKERLTAYRSDSAAVA
jgi:superfamily II DNA or RNA helicase